MRRITIVDGYNVLHSSKRYRRLLENDIDSARRALVADLGAWREPDEAIHLVFDGDQGPGLESVFEDPSGVTIVYAGAGSDADSVIEAIASKHASTAERVVVVSSDRQIRFATGWPKVSILSVKLFDDRIAVVEKSWQEEAPRKLKVRVEDRIDPTLKNQLDRMSGRGDAS